MRYKTYNQYDKYILLLIISLAFGNIGGALQISRFFAIIFIPQFLTCYSSSSYYAKGYYKFFITLIFYGVFSLLWSYNAGRGFEELIYYIVHSFLFLEILVFSKKANNPANFITLGWTISVAITLIIAMWEVTTDNHLSYSQQQSNLVMNMGGNMMLTHKFASVTFYNYNSYVTFLCFSLPFILYRMRQFAVDKTEKLFVLAVVSLSVICILYNASRGGLLSCLIMVITYMFSSQSRKSSFRILFVTLIVSASVLYVFRDDLLLVITARLTSEGSLGEESRLVIWESAIKLFLHTLGLGVGLGGMTDGMKLFSRNGILIPHNMLLEILVQYGVFFFSVVILFLMKSLFLIKKIKDINIRLLLNMIFFAFPVYSIIDSGYLLQPHFYAFFSSLVVFCNYQRIQSSINISRN